MGKPRLADYVIACHVAAAFMAAEAVAALEELRRTALRRQAAAPQIPAWLAADFEATVSRADPEDGASDG